MTKASCSWLVLCLTIALSSLLPAQAWPGGQGNAPARQRSEYVGYIRESVHELARAFESAAGARDAARLASLYTEGATLVTTSGTVVGRDVVRDRFARTLPRMRAVRLRIEKLDATGYLAHVAGRLTYEVVHAGGARAYDVPISLALESHRDSWRIQTQVGGELPVTVAARTSAPSILAPGDTASLGVQVTDATGNPLPDVLVAFQLDAGSATLLPAVVTTNAEGLAATTLRLDRGTERVVVRATAAALIGEPVFFRIAPAQVAGQTGDKGAVAPVEGRNGEQ